MNTTEKVITVGIGLAAIVWAFWPGVVFYPRALGVGGNKPIPKWFGRLWFVVFGLWFIFMGINTNERTGKLTAGIFGIILGAAVVYGGAVVPQQEGRTVWRRRVLSLFVGLLFLFCAWDLLWRR
jgi:hypothetical protein